MKLQLLLVAILAAPVLLSQDSKPASRPAPPITLPVSDQSTAFKEKDPIVVTIARVPDEQAPATRPFEAYTGWQVRVGDEAFSMIKPSIVRLGVLLFRLAKAQRDGLSERALLIEVDIGAPYGFVHKVIELAAAARIYRIWIGVASKQGEGIRALDIWVPTTRDGDVQPGEVIFDEIRVLMSWNTSAGKLERLFGQRLVPPTLEGDRELERLIRESREEYAKRGKTDVPFILDCGPRVPWQSVVDVLSMGRRAGLKSLQFAPWAELGK